MLNASTVAWNELSTSEQAMTLIRRILHRDYERHKVWLVVDSVGLVLSTLLVVLPGPNVVGYYFAFRVVGHWLFTLSSSCCQAAFSSFC